MKPIKYIVYILLFIAATVLLSKYLRLDNNKVFDIIATFISITTGFTITALSIIATSPFSRQLYLTESTSDNSQTLLHVLINDFRRATFFFITTIGLIVILNLYPEKYNEKTYKILSLMVNDLQLIKSLIICFTMLSFYLFINLFYTFSKFVIKSSTN